jgi:folate-dependent phosphoribosylglycinamide formyltransferase PurN
MRIVILSSSLYSETACAMAVHLAEKGYVPSGALSLSTWNRKTLLRKLGQWGPQKVASYARAKFLPRPGQTSSQMQNPYLRPLLGGKIREFRTLQMVGKSYEFPVAVCRNQNSPASIAHLKKWAPDLIVFTGGNILRKQLLDVPRLGVLNLHLGLLPEIRGMSSPEWSLLNGVPVGITIHYMDAGIDTGPFLQACEFPDAARCESLSDLRNRLIAFGIAKVGEVISAIDRGAIVATPQSDLEKNNQFFVMHERLRMRASMQLAKNRMTVFSMTTNSATVGAERDKTEAIRG